MSKMKMLIALMVILVTGCTAQRDVVTINVVETRPIGGGVAREMLPLNTYKRAEAQLSWNLNGTILHQPAGLTWITPTNFWYRTTTEKGQEFWLVDAAGMIRGHAFDHAVLATRLSEATGTEIDPWALPFNSIQFGSDISSFTFNHERKQWKWDRETGRLEEVTGPSAPPFSNVSPDGSKAVYIRDHNLWMRNLVTGDDIQLTTDGIEYYGYATNSQGWSRSNAPIVAWSPDSRKISTYRLDERGVELMHLLETASPRVKLHSWPYALPGDTIVPMHHRLVIDLDSRRTVRLNTPPDHQRTSNCCGLTRGSEWADNQFTDDGSKLAFVSTSRDYKTVTLKVADTATGAVRTIFQESSDEYTFESNLTSRGVPNWRVFHDTNEFIWYTRADEWGHLYLYDLQSGTLKNRITTGEWNVIDILHIDTESRTIWFSAVGREADRDPYQSYIYSVRFDGSDLRLLTPEEGDHQAWFSPNGRYFVDMWSDFRQPPKTVLRNRNGDIVKELEKADISRLLATGWTAPEPFVTKGRDGKTEIYGIMFKPSNFDPSRSYPIINNIYPGPQVGSIRGRNFGASYSGQAQALAELGFIVVQIDGMGTPLRSRSFHTAYAGDMADNGLPDQIAAMKELATRYSFIDLDRVGIYGHSGGGFATAAAMLTHPDFFKVGVSSAGNIDNRGYTYYWGEKFQGLLVKNPDGTDSYTNQSLPLMAGNLKGKLLITYGSMDSNVHPNMAKLLINELIRADKDFDMMVLPNRGHGYGNEPFHIRLTWNYFVQHLLGVEPNPDFRIVRDQQTQ